MKKAINYIISFLSVFLLVLAVFIVVIGTYSMKKNKPLVIFGYYYSVVGSSSMEGDKTKNPINKGEFIIAKKKVTYKIGDDIVFKSTEKDSKGLYIVHRIIRIEDDYYVTHGINNPDGVVEHALKENVIGKVVNSFSLFGLGNLVLTKRNMIFSCFVILFIIFLVNQTIVIFKTYQQEKEKEKIEKWKEEIKKEILEEENHK